MTIRTEQEELLNNIEINTRQSGSGTANIYGSFNSVSEAVYIADTDEHTRPFFAVYALSDSVIDTSECTTNITNVPATLNVTQFQTLYGNFDSIELDSRTIIAYKG